MTDTAVDPGLDQETVDLLEQLRTARQQRDAYDALVKELNAQIAERIERTAYFADGTGQRWQASVVRKEDIVVNLDLLRERSEDLYIDVTKRVFDRTAFEHAVRSGVVSRDMAFEVATFKQQNPYIAFKKLTEEDSND